VRADAVEIFVNGSQVASQAGREGNGVISVPLASGSAPVILSVLLLSTASNDTSGIAGPVEIVR
jgi:hypothetical protein